MLPDFSSQNLRGKSFKGENLTGANFSYADIRGADFTGAILKGANFSNVRAGLQRCWAIILAVVSYILLAILENLLVSNRVIERWFSPETISAYTILPGAIATLLLAAFFIVTFLQDLETGIRTSAIGLTVTVAFAAILNLPRPWTETIPNIAIVTFSFVLTAFVLTIGSIAVAGLLAWTIAVGGLIIKCLYGFKLFNVLSSVVVAVAFYGKQFSITIGGATLTENFSSGEILRLIFVTLLVFANAYMGWRTVVGDPRFSLLRKRVIPLATLGGTSFRGSDLTDANFTNATLKSADFRKANLTRTCWFGIRQLSLARVDKTYLQNPKICQLVTSGDGENQNFDGLDMRSLNLKDANLTNSNFIRADLSETNLQKSNLSNAKLVKAQLEKTDLTGACLTGIYIEDWTAVRNAKLDKVECKYLYMGFPNSENNPPHRLPVEGEFVDDEFRVMSRSTLDTLDIYHHLSFDPEVAVDAIASLARDYRERLEIVAIQDKEDRVIIKIKTSEGANHYLQLSDYFSRYYQMLTSGTFSTNPVVLDNGYLVDGMDKLVERIKRADDETIRLHSDGIIVAAENVSSTYDNRRTQVIKAGRNIKVTGSGAFNIGDIKNSTVADTINQQISSIQSDIQLNSLLKYLQITIKEDPSLTSENKTDALEQLRLLRATENNLQYPEIKKQRRKAVKYLKGLIQELPSTPNLLEVRELLAKIEKQLRTSEN